MDYNAKTRSFEIGIKVFTDDLETALEKLNQNQKTNKLSAQKINELTAKFITESFQIKPKGQPWVSPDYVGFEHQGDGTWIYVEYIPRGPLSGTTVRAKMFHDIFDDQTNLVNITYGNFKKSLVFNAKTTENTIE